MTAQEGRAATASEPLTLLQANEDKQKKTKQTTQPTRGILWGQLHPIRHLHPNDNGSPKTRGLRGRAAAGSALQILLCTVLAAFLPGPACLFPAPWVHHRGERSNPVTGYSGPAKVSRWSPVCYRATPDITYDTGTPQKSHTTCLCASLTHLGYQTKQC